MSSTRSFQVTEESWGNHYHVTTDDLGRKRHLFVENNPFANKSSDIAIHEGSDIEGPILGASKFHRFSPNCDIQMGEPVEKCRWTMVRKGLISPSYSFRADMKGQTRNLIWKRTRAMGAGASAYGNSKLVDDESQDVLAVFSSDPHSLVTGLLDVYGDHDETFHRLVLLTGLVFREKHRRQTVRTARAGRDDVFTTGGALGGAGGSGC